MGHSIEVSEERGVRYLHFGTEWVQGAMRLSRPHQLVLAYTQEMLSFLLFRPAPLKVLMIGLGAGSLPKFFRKELPNTAITVVEVNPAVIPIARDLFRVPGDDDRLDVQVGDGYAWVHESGATFDAIFVDGYDHRARPGKFETPAFYEACVARLAPQGVLVSNVFGQVRGHAQTMRHLREAFPRAVIERIGAAPSIGWKRWYELAARLIEQKIDPLSIHPEDFAADLSSDQRFEAWVKALQTPPPPRKGRDGAASLPVTGRDGSPIGTVSLLKGTLTFAPAAPGGPFAQWLSDNAATVIARLHEDFLTQQQQRSSDGKG